MALHVRINVPPIRECLEACAEGLVLLDVELMRYAHDRGADLPALYDTDVVYRAEPKGREWWESAADLLSLVSQRSGDCEDLAAYRTAELRFFDDELAHLRVIQTPRGSYHCVVERADGTIEDPSEVLLSQESERTGVPMETLARKTTR